MRESLFNKVAGLKLNTHLIFFSKDFTEKNLMCIIDFNLALLVGKILFCYKAPGLQSTQQGFRLCIYMNLQIQTGTGSETCFKPLYTKPLG